MFIYVVEIKTCYSKGRTAVDVAQERRVTGRRLVLVSRGVVRLDLHILAIMSIEAKHWAELTGELKAFRVEKLLVRMLSWLGVMWLCSSQDQDLVAVTGAPPEEELSSKVRDELFRAVTLCASGLEVLWRRCVSTDVADILNAFGSLTPKSHEV